MLDPTSGKKCRTSKLMDATRSIPSCRRWTGTKGSPWVVHGFLREELSVFCTIKVYDSYHQSPIVGQLVILPQCITEVRH
jgi:hypothetical protein